MRELKNIVLKFCKRKLVRRILLPLIKIIGKKTYYERLEKIEAEEIFFNSIDNGTTIRRGPFQGMKYPSLTSYGSELAPKIIGSYEIELNDVIQSAIKEQKYSEILDIGCAEGYYAVGLAMKTNAKVYAYDIKTEAIDLCRKMARLNEVEQKIVYNGFCSSEVLAKFPFTGRALIISDCEGYELELFSKQCIPNLLNSDLLIELHDFVNPNISRELPKVFKDTHDITIIKSFKRDPSNYPELDKFSSVQKQFILSECRGGVFEEQLMEWAFIRSRQPQYSK